MRDNLKMAVLILALLVLSACGTWAGSDLIAVKDGHTTSVDNTSINSPLAWTQTLYDWALEHAECATNSQAGRNSNTAQVVPESNTLVGFGAALVLNGLGVAGTGYYLRRRYNRASAMRYAGRQVVHLPMFMDTAVSILVLLAVSPVLFAVAVAGAVRSGSPKVYGQTRQAYIIDNKEL